MSGVPFETVNTVESLLERLSRSNSQSGAEAWPGMLYNSKSNRSNTSSVSN